MCKKYRRSGKISFSKACEILVTFKATYVSEYQFSVLKGNLNPRSLKTIQNNNTKIQILLEYYSLDNFERFNRALEFSCKLGTKDFSAIYFSSSLINSLLDDPPPIVDPDLELTILQ